MTNWAFETWPRIITFAMVLGVSFGLAHMLGQILTGQDQMVDGATIALAGLVLGGYLIIGAAFYRNPGRTGE